MRDFELYQAVLGLEAPWTVVNVELDVTGQQVTVTVEAGAGPYPCPECQEPVPGYDRKYRRWRHLDTCQFTTWIQADLPRVNCPIHGVKQIAVPWAEPGSQFTAWFERLAIDLLRECSVKGAAGLLRITWDEAGGIKKRSVARGLSRRTQDVVPHLGVDEKAIAKGHRYLTVVADLERSRVLYLADDRKQESLDRFWATLTPAQREGIEAIAMDMWEPYIQSTQAHLEEADAKIVFDKFHVAQHLHEAVDRVRRTEHRTLKQAGDDRLTGTKYLWLMRPTDMTAEQRATFRTLQQTDLKVARAWTLKERFRQFWDYTYCGAAQKFFARWFWRATHSRLAPLAEVANRIQRHLPNVLTYLRHGITNAAVEAVNATIQWVKKPARGFRNVEHFKTAIYFHCGGLDLYPTHTKA
ncbi:MAG TPA: ISL3 family transposase [Nitrospiraceae bacterium]|nr:ISL3 family transposase [Nitrospiraceae bacterium]